MLCHRSRPKINPRSGGDSKEYKLIGLFKNAEVKDSNNEFKGEDFTGSKAFIRHSVG